MSAHWVGFHDSQSLIRDFVYYAGLSPNGSDLVSPTTLPPDHTSFLHLLTTPLPSGARVYSTVVATNRAGLSIIVSSDGVVVDSVPPTLNTQPTILTQWVGSRENQTHISNSAMRIAWNFTDNLHSVQQYFVSLMSDSRSRIPIPPLSVVNADYVSLSSLALSDGNSYHVRVISCDLAGLCTSSPLSSAVLVDSTPPIDGYFAIESESVANLTHSRTVPGGMTWRNRPFRNVSQLNIAFLGFSDPHSQITAYWATVGSTFSGSDLLPPTLLSPRLAANESLVISMATVILSRQVVISEALFVSLWAVNGVGLSSHIVQASFLVSAGAQANNGSLVLLRSPSCEIASCMGHCTCAARGDLCSIDPSLTDSCIPLAPSSLPTDRKLRVYNIIPQLLPGSLTPPGPLFTTITDKLFGRWELLEPLSQAVQQLEWSVGIRDDPMGPGAGLMDTVNDNVWQAAGSALSAVFSVSEEYPVVDGEVYVFYVRAWYSPQQYAVFTSEGVVVDVRGPLTITGKRVRDGSQGSRDLDFTSSPSNLSLAWDGVFSSALSGNYSTIKFGIGTFPGSDNVYPLTSAATGQVMTSMVGLGLQVGVAYYSMVRATNDIGVSVTSLSDGVVVDTSSAVTGTVLGGSGRLPSLAQVDTDTLSLRWYGFKDPESAIHHYEVAVTNTTSPPPLSVYSDTGIRLQTTLTGLSLIPGGIYYGHVVAVNRAELRSPDVASGGVAIEDRGPEGRVCEQRSPEALLNPSFENNTLTGVPCPRDTQGVTTATYGWDLNTSYISVVTYADIPPRPTDGCFAVTFIGTISQYFQTVPGNKYQLRFSYSYLALPHRAALRVQLPGVDRLLFRPDIPAAGGQWHTANIQFVPDDTTSLLVLSSALSDSAVYIDHVTITWCSQYRHLISTGLSVTWPRVIRTTPQIIASSKVKLSVEWDIVEAVSGVREFWWAIGSIPGGVQLQRYRSTGQTTEDTSRELVLSDGEEVHITVVAWSNGGLGFQVHSGPVLVDLTPPPLSTLNYSTPVWDGVGEEDVDFQSSLVVGINWSGLTDRESGLELCSWAVGMLMLNNYSLLN